MAPVCRFLYGSNYKLGPPHVDMLCHQIILFKHNILFQKRKLVEDGSSSDCSSSLLDIQLNLMAGVEELVLVQKELLLEKRLERRALEELVRLKKIKYNL